MDKRETFLMDSWRRVDLGYIVGETCGDFLERPLGLFGEQIRRKVSFGFVTRGIVGEDV